MSVISIDGSSLGNALTQLLCAEDISPGEFYVYVLFRPDGRPCYVGKGRGNRWLHHERNPRHYNKHLARIITRAGGTLSKVKFREGLSNDDASRIETALIAYIGRKPNGPLVNLTDGGDGKRGYVAPQSTREKISRANTGKKMSPEGRARMSAASRGKPKSLNHNLAVSAALKGRSYSDETLQKMREGAARRWARESERDILRNYHAMMTPEQRAQRSLTIKLATIEAMKDPHIRAKISESRRR